MIWHNAAPNDVLKELSTDIQQGLTSDEAELKLKEYGENLSVCEHEVSISDAVISQVKKPASVILLILLVIEVLRQLVTGENSYTLPIVATLILIGKHTLCTFLEYYSRNMLFSLKNRIHTSARVIRDGKETLIKASKLVPGDIIKISEGDFVPADARILQSVSLRCDEAALFGEKEVISVQKDANAMHEDHIPVKNRSNMLFCGCHVMTGNAVAVVTATGEDAEIRRLVKKNRVFTHKGIQDRISDRFNDFLKVYEIVAIIAVAVITVIATFAIPGNVGWGKFLEALILAVSFYVAVVPGCFPTRIACLFAMGIKRIEKDKAVIFTPQTVEKLAAVTVICADKTGTLTQNRMSLQRVFDGENTVDLGTNSLTKQCEIAMRFGALCCDSDDGVVADHTESALVSAASRYLNIVKSDFDSEFPRVAGIMLTPERKIKTTVNMIEGKVFSIVRGAPDIILERCNDIDFQKITEAYKKMCSEGMRVLAIAYKTLDDIPSHADESELEYGLTFLGLFGITDRERHGIANDISRCSEGGISTVMFTGDHINTAVTMATKMGITKDGDLNVTGDQIKNMSDEELREAVGKIKVCARTSAEERMRIVKALKANGETVLITADSAANFVAMASADVGCAMGKTGTDVAIGNADIVVYDDRFNTIVRAIRNARGIFANFTKYINYYVSMCAAALTSLVLNICLFGSPVPTAQLLLIGSIFALVYPIASIGYETADISVMKLPPRTVGERLFDLKSLLLAAAAGVGVGIPSAIVYFVSGADRSAPAASFSALVFSLILYMFSSRSTDLFFKRILHNRFILACSAICIIAVLIIILTPLSALFGLGGTVSLLGLVTSIVVPLIIPLVFETLKLFKVIK